MARLTVILALGGVAVLAAGPVAAQYYPPPPPYGYAPPPGYPPPGYDGPPRAARDFGFRCNARAFTPRGPQRVVCDLDRPRRLGRPCECPPPPPPPGYAPGPYLEGRVVR